MKAIKPSNIKRFLVGVVITMAVVSLTSFADASDRKGRFTLEPAVGFMADTPDHTAFALAFSGDYYLTNEFSVGPLLQMGFTNDLFLMGLTVQAKYTFDLGGVPNLKPHLQAGLGFAYADLKPGGGGNQSGTSFLIPFGPGAEYKLTNSISLDGTVLFNYTNLDVRNENFFVSVLIGAKFIF
jgi:hypothetical protein